MKRLVTTALLLLLVLAVVPVQLPAHASGSPEVLVHSLYTVNRYGFAVVNETVTFVNNSTEDLVPPTVVVGIGNLSGSAVASVFAGSGFTEGSSPPGGPYSVTGSSLAAGANASFTISTLLNGVVTTAKNGSLMVLTLSSPSISVPVKTLREQVAMPGATILVSPPAGLTLPASATGQTYSKNFTNVASATAVSSVRAVKPSTLQDFNPLDVYRATRMITVGADGTPMVTDSLWFTNLGTASMSSLHVSPLTTANAKVTILPSVEPRLLSQVQVSMSSYAITLAAATGFPVAAGSNYTITFQYPLPAKYYTSSGGTVTLNLPESPPIQAFVDQYTIGISAPSGVKVVQAGPQPMTNVSPWQGGTTSLSYALAVGWAVDDAIPAASAVFVLLLIGLFVSRSQVTEEEETEEETSTERASDMIKAFDEKTNLINGLWSEIESKDPNELGKEYFDELRGRLDTFRSKALQRLNELKQKSGTQKFSDLLNQIQNTEREVDRAAKDKLNLYDQYYMKRMRKEVYDRLLPQYGKRLERALNQLSDELHVVQREAKLL